MQLTSEEVNTKVTVLASLRRDRDTNDLGRTALEDQEITNADEVAWDGDGAWWVTTAWLDNSDGFAGSTMDAGWGTLIDADRLFPCTMVEGMEDAVSGTLNSTAERVVVAFVVVVTHFGSW